mmetsp:Transcript_117128/g.303855  ORF Transcript_117128/g.303855 Transcript_117128/m.303855 type:complete len:215 (+) Transcript_117128:3862-4506(+)
MSSCHDWCPAERIHQATASHLRVSRHHHRVSKRKRASAAWRASSEEASHLLGQAVSNPTSLPHRQPLHPAHPGLHPCPRRRYASAVDRPRGNASPAWEAKCSCCGCGPRPARRRGGRRATSPRGPSRLASPRRKEQSLGGLSCHLQLPSFAGTPGGRGSRRPPHSLPRLPGQKAAAPRNFRPLNRWRWLKARRRRWQLLPPSLEDALGGCLPSA